MNWQKIRSRQRGVAVSLSQKAVVTALIGSIALIGWIFKSALLTSIFPGLPPMSVNTALGFILGAISLWFWHQLQSDEELENRVAERTASLINANNGLQESYQLLSSVIEGISDAVFVKDRSGRYVFVNQAMSQKLGKSGAEILGFNDDDLFAPENAQKFTQTDNRIMERGEREEIEEEVLKNNQHKIYLSTKSPWRDSNGNVIGLIGVIKDITERKQTEAALKYREWLAQYFVEHTSIPAAVFDTQMRYIIVSQRWLTDYQLEGLDIIGRSHYEVFPEIPQRWKEIHQRCLAGAVEICEEDPFVRADGRIDWLRWEVRPWYEQTGAIGGIILFTEVITARKEAEFALKQSEQRYANLAAVIPVGVYCSDTQGNINYLNQRWCELTGLSAEQGMGKGWEKAIHPDDRDRIASSWCEAIHNQNIFCTEYRYQRPDGVISWVYGQAVAERAANGEIVGYIGTVTDITERKRAEDCLRENEARLRLALQTTKSGIWDWDFVTGCARVSEEYCLLLGIDRAVQSLSYEDWLNCIHPDDRTSVIAALNQAIQQYKDYEIEYRIQHPEGIRWIATKGQAFYDAAGNAVRMLGNIQDITDRKQAQINLAEGELRFRIAAQSSSDLIYEWDTVTGRMQWFGDIDTRLGYDPGGIKRTLEGWETRIHPDDRASVASQIEQCLETGAAFEGEYRIADRNGEYRIWVDRGRVTFDAQGKPGKWYGAITDITERKQTQEAREASEEQLRLTLEFSQIGSWDWQILENRIAWNSNHFRLMGLDPDTKEVNYQTWRERVHPDELERVEAAIRQAIENHTDYDTEYRLVHPDRSIHWIIGKGRAIYDRSGQAVRMLGVIIDITDRKRAEAALQASEEQLRLTLEFAQIGSWAWDMLENRLTWNSKLFQLLGLDPNTAEANYHTWRERIHPDDLERVETAINQAVERETDYDAEHRVIHPDGTVLWIIARGRAIYNQSGRPLKMLGVVIDITDRKQAEISLQQSEERFRWAIVNSPLPIMLHAEDGVILQVNHAWTEISGYSPQEIPTLADWTQKAYGSRKELVQADIQRLYNLDRRVSEGEYTIRTRSGETRIWEFYSAPLGKLPDGRRLVISTAIDITERKRAEADLQQYKDIFQFSEHGLAVSKGPVLEIVNPAFARMHGYSVAEMIGKPILSLFPSDTWAKTVSFMQELNEVGHLTHESYHLRKDGTIFPILLDVTMVKDREGNPLYRIATLLDITDRKKAETALLESEERLRLALQAANQGFYDLNIPTGEAIVSAEYAQMLGYEPEEFQETNAKWSERLHPEERETVFQVFLDYIAGKSDAYRVEFRQKTKTGEWKWILSLGKVVEWDESGKPVRMVGTHTDISDRKLAELALRYSETQLRSILENMPVMLDSFDAQLNIIVWNQECERVTGYSAEEVIGNPQIWEMLYPDPIYRQKMRTQWAEKGNNYRNWEWDLLSKNGEKKTIAWSNISDIFPVPGWGSWGVGIDISDRKQAELKVIQLNQNLEERVKERTAELSAANKELEAFSYSVSHDLRAPLRGIDGFSKVLLERYANQLDEKGKHYLDRIRAGTQRMGELIEDMLMLSRVTRTEMKRTSVNLSALAQEISESLSEFQPERSVTWNIAPEITVLGDGALLRIVLENLLSNAWKFTSTRTQTEIEFGLTILPENTQAYFVKDNGVGFDMNYVNKLFIAFQRLHSTNEFPGTGVGLAIVQRIIHRHGGKVWAQGIIDRGAAFYFTLG
ncbi:PAS domain S-box protein [Aerosakkonemataceae cyanobacterium BLCC-F50]|uniref:histidine kinase n=1 Tax=Floridaenema flaviceps BLCC-F50 TaxID=3153642 RepID=A0ABV4Y4K1_9CYAN